jgi:hypothetical protein
MPITLLTLSELCIERNEPSKFQNMKAGDIVQLWSTYLVDTMPWVQPSEPQKKAKYEQTWSTSVHFSCVYFLFLF